MPTNTATVTGNGMIIRQTPVKKSWLEECSTACQRPGPQQLTNVHRTLKADDLTVDVKNATAQAFRKDGLGMTDDISVLLDLPSFCGPATHWNSRTKRCVPDKIPKSICGDGSKWDSDAGQCVRADGCESGFRYAGNVCMPVSSQPAPTNDAPSEGFNHVAP